MIKWLVIAISFLSLSLKAQPSVNLYIETWRNECILQMEKYGIPASITMAQGILESASGTSDLAIQAKNHFGIKCHNDWDGKKFFKDDDKKDECFRVYDEAQQSFEDHSLFLKRPRYESLFQLDPTDYKSWAHGLKQCGYATNPKYPQLLIDLIEKHDLYVLDQGQSISMDDLKKKLQEIY
jgi:flagellum-specific peptidoglycan hydrolase FlgJ